MGNDQEYLQILSKEEVIGNLWSEYKRTSEYRKERKCFGISEHNPIVRRRLEDGLKGIYSDFVHNLAQKQDIFEIMMERSVGDWVGEWKKMHDTLFKKVLKTRGNFRDIDVTFGALGEGEELYNIPKHRDVSREIQALAFDLKNKLKEMPPSLEEGCQILAQVHYEFIRIHPFPDGNGRIARAITDQIAMCFKYTPAMGGYPRHNATQKARYHDCIRACAVEGPDCLKLTQWIKNYIETVSDKIIG